MRIVSKPIVLALAALIFSGTALTDEVQVAVAANFAGPIKAIAALLEKTTGHQLKITLGASGKLYAQIKNGAPFDVLLAANTEVPATLEKDGLTQTGSRFTYAVGKLVLWSTDATLVDAKGDVLRKNTFRKLAYASPKVAPYGAAAVQVMENLGLQATLAPKLVQGESIGQTYSFVVTGNAELGFVALSQVLAGGQLQSGSIWHIPQKLYQPIQQDAVILRRGLNKPGAQALMTLLKSQTAKDLILDHGYAL